MTLNFWPLIHKQQIFKWAGHTQFSPVQVKISISVYVDRDSDRDSVRDRDKNKREKKYIDRVRDAK